MKVIMHTGYPRPPIPGFFLSYFRYTILLKLTILSGFVEEGHIYQNFKNLYFLPNSSNSLYVTVVLTRMVCRASINFFKQNYWRNQVFSRPLET